MQKKMAKFVLNFLWNFKHPSYQARIIYYHSIHPTYPLSHRPEQFRAQMQWLYEQGYTCPILSEFDSYHQDQKIVFITFDDGYLDNWTYALPILLEFGFKATFFVCSGYVEPTPIVMRHKLYDLPMISRDVLLDMQHMGMEIGSHGVTHQRLSKLNFDEQMRELVTSKDCLEQILAKPITSFAYPNGQKGAFSNNSTQLALDAGYQRVCSTLWGTCCNQNTTLKRCEMSNQDKFQEFIAKIIGMRDYRAVIDILMDKSKVWDY